MRKIARPYGHWPSPISADSVAGHSRRLGLIAGDGAWVYWSESRPEEGGRSVLMRARPGKPAEELIRPPYSARTRVHEYGGGEFMIAGGIHQAWGFSKDTKVG